MGFALFKRAEDWPWSSVHARLYGGAEQKKILSPWPTPEPRDYRKWLNHAEGREEIEKIRDAIRMSRPYGSKRWVSKAVGERGSAALFRF